MLERLTRVAGQPLQRIGLSATVGNHGELLTWLQGSSAGSRLAHVVAPHMVEVVDRPPPGDIELEYVGSLANAATVIAGLHGGGRRPGSSRNCLFLTLDGDALTEAAALLLLWARAGWSR
ncbi:hypothetical protein [Micromonospora chersina]|uniref:hypothetical protein n=1 Tax=Micromonospora chersina TaxID=47854 RepID=UPI003719FD85